MSGDVETEAVEENSDYESDPEEVKMSLKMRRREASDDEECEEKDEVVVENSRSGVVESDGEGAADEYDEEDDEEYYYDDDDDYEEEVAEYVDEVGRGSSQIGGGEVSEKAGEVIEAVLKGDGEGKGEEEEKGEKEGEEVKKEGEEVKKEEPFAVPTSGAFYMHDDRFRGNADGRGRGRDRRSFAGKKLWKSKDERKWGHDKFQELVQDRHYEEGRRSSRGSNRGRGKPRGGSRGYGRGNRMGAFSEISNQNAAPKDLRGRGPRRYQPVMKNKGETQPPLYKQSAGTFDKSSRTGSGRMATSTNSSNLEHELAPAKKVGSNLNSASPPFYPLGTSTKGIASTQKKEMHTRNFNKNIRSPVDPNFSTPVSNPLLRGKNVSSSMGIDKLHIDNAVFPANTRANNNLHLRSSASSSSSPNHLAHHRGQGRVGVPSRPTVFQPPQTYSPINKVSPLATQAKQRNSVQIQSQSPLQAPSQQLAQHPLIVSQTSSPPKAGKGAGQGTGRGSLVSVGTQVMGSGGNVGAGHGDPNMPAFFPFMQFGSQHPGGMGVPTVGMAFPGYVGQPNGLGSSEMTWLPMLASAASAMGGTYSPPYIAVDGNYHHRPTGQTSALPVPSKENDLSKPNNELKPQERSEFAHNEFSQRQNKPRRYSEMSFSQ